MFNNNKILVILLILNLASVWLHSIHPKFSFVRIISYTFKTCMPWDNC